MRVGGDALSRSVPSGFGMGWQVPEGRSEGAGGRMAVGDHMATEDQFREAEPFLGDRGGPERRQTHASSRESSRGSVPSRSPPQTRRELASVGLQRFADALVDVVPMHRGRGWSRTSVDATRRSEGPQPPATGRRYTYSVRVRRDGGGGGGTSRNAHRGAGWAVVMQVCQGWTANAIWLQLGMGRDFCPDAH
ncbi:hypothetical protein HETIRDRAFT_102155 [Heterobasidion irregulare TC 32-1]|uniref:Uncharacterized protein n=1 Tax=Heterobasidion irregulare (strain TC 32-1) TaxID=747525 RepID=W4K5K9_HETIT|nr:uncharacterized protein HETIRDRAFT_102155 [Heterobasidion irregulare TC 32-1]ETW81113.1 hypothetical protein HETIRDRAFT_102155 [Heterobasidion irregulare TC 32-1]